MRYRLNSIRIKITFMVIAFTVFIVAMAWLICRYFISDIFINNLKSNLVLTYESCNNQIGRLSSGEIHESGIVDAKINNPMESIIMIYDVMGDEIYSTISDKAQMMDSLRGMMEYINESWKDEPGTYEIRRNHDMTINADYYDLIGKMDNGFSVIIRSPIAQVSNTMDIVSSLFVRIAAGLVIASTLFVLLFSNIFVIPIKHMSIAAKRMALLDFNVKIPIISCDEMGELGLSMNDMSEKLEASISALKSANAKLEQDIIKKEQIDDMRKEFLSHVSHELKTPIALVQGYAEGLKDNLFDDEESKEYYCDVIIDEAHKMNQLVKKLLDLNELEFGENKIEIVRFDLTELISDIISASSILINDAHTEVEFDSSESVFVWADEYMIEEAFTNYFTNAIHYVKEDGKIKITLERKERNIIRVSVYNDGNIISDNDIKKLFIKFYKVDKARTREYGGSGIGLSIVAATMEAHGREYGVYNTDTGVVFYFDLEADNS